MLAQYGMSFEFLRSVKKVAVSYKVAASVGAKALCNIYHFRIEFADPLHLVFIINWFPHTYSPFSDLSFWITRAPSITI